MPHTATDHPELELGELDQAVSQSMQKLSSELNAAVSNLTSGLAAQTQKVEAAIPGK